MPNLIARSLALLLLAGCSSHKILARVTVDPARSAYLFSKVNVFDGDTVLGERDVRVRDGKIEAVADPGTLQPAEGEVQIDGEGRTLMPGLIDSHVHLDGPGEAIWDLSLAQLEEIPPAYVYAGVTTAVVMQADGPGFLINEKAQNGELVAPRLYMAGPRLTAPDGFPINLYRALLPWPVSSLATSAIRTAQTAEEAREVVDEAARELEPAFFKITSDAFPPGAPKLSTEAMVAAIKRSKELGIRPTAHIGAPEDHVLAAEAGLELFAHPPTGALITQEQLAKLAALKVPFASTLRFLTASAHVARDQGTPLDREMVDPAALAKFNQRPKDFEYPGVAPGTDAEKLLVQYEQNLRDNTIALWKAGVPMFVGTDAGSPGVFPGASIHRELVLLVEAGLPTLDVLRAATSAPADFLDKDHTFGRVAAGQRADLLLVKGDPIADITATAAIVEVFQNGRRMRRSVAAR